MRAVLNHPRVSAFAFLAVVAAGASVLVGFRAGDDPAPAAGAGADAVAVRTVLAREAGGSAGVLEAVGTLQANHDAALAFPVAGVVQGVTAEVGDAVAAGAVLAELDPVPYRAALDQAEARVAYLRTQVARLRDIYDLDAIALEEVQRTEADLGAAEAQARLAAWNLDRTRLRAPFAGRVASRTLEPGQVLAAGTPAFTLLAVDTLRVDVGIPAGDLVRLREHAEVRVRRTDVDDVTARGRVHHVPVSGDPRSGTVPVRVEIPNPRGGLLPGMTVSCAFTPGEAGAETVTETRVLLAAVRMTPDGARVFRVRDGRVESVPVTLGPVRGDEVAVAGVSPGDELVAEAPDRLRAGDRVTPVAP